MAGHYSRGDANSQSKFSGIDRDRAVKDTPGTVCACKNRRGGGPLLVHLSLLVILAGGLVRAVWGEKGTLGIREGEALSRCEQEGGKSWPLPFAVRLVKFEVEHYPPSTPPGGAVPGIIRVIWPERQLEARVPAEVNASRPLRPPSPAGTGSDTYQLRVERYEPDFVMEGAGAAVKSRSGQPNNPAVLLSVAGAAWTNRVWVFARFPGMTPHAKGSDRRPMPFEFRFVVDNGQEAGPPPVKAFRSTLEIIENGAVVVRGSLAVNAPLSHRGYTLYQSGYNPEVPGWTSLQVVRDPSVPLVYGGYVMLVAGLLIVFGMRPRPVAGGSP